MNIAEHPRPHRVAADPLHAACERSSMAIEQKTVTDGITSVTHLSFTRLDQPIAKDEAQARHSAWWRVWVIGISRHFSGSARP